jgi:hypothetical protein
VSCTPRSTARRPTPTICATPSTARAVLHHLVTGAEGIFAAVDAPGAHAGLLRVAGEGASSDWITNPQALARLRRG